MDTPPSALTIRHSALRTPHCLILHATGTNRDHEAAQAIELAGGQPEIVHLNQLRSGEKRWSRLPDAGRCRAAFPTPMRSAPASCWRSI